MKITQIQKLIKIVYSFIVRVLVTGVCLVSVKHVRLFFFLISALVLCVQMQCVRVFVHFSILSLAAYLKSKATQKKFIKIAVNN